MTELFPFKDHPFKVKDDIVFFKAKDADAITNTFKEYTADMVKKAARPSVLAELEKLALLAKNTIIQKVKHKNKEQERFYIK